MGLLSRILGMVGLAVSRRSVRAGYDAARTTDENRRHWSHADALGPNASLAPAVVATVRKRARYEVANNSIAKGIVTTVANQVIGRGPRLQVLTGDRESRRRIERSFAAWARRVDLAGRLRTARMGRTVDGEALALLTTNPGIDHPVQLDVRLVEPDQLTHGHGATVNLTEPVVDGIDLDEHGNPLRYWILRQHPGETPMAFDKPMRVAPQNVIHWFRIDRAGQARGMSELAPALSLFAVSRRYTMATLTAAELAANVAGTLETEAPADDDESVLPEPMDTFELERAGVLALPHGTKFNQVKAEQPTTTFPAFRRALIAEIARCLNMPLNIAGGDSSGYNYASGRLDHQGWWDVVDIDRADCEAKVLEPILRAWLREAALVGIVPASYLVDGEIEHYWFWPGHQHVDPVKEANAQATRLSSLTTTLADEYARQGDDWREQLEQIAEERRVMSELGLTVPGETARDEDDDEDDDDPAPADREQEAAHV